MVQAKKSSKNVHLKVHHQKAYRKRHVALLVGSIVGLIVLLSILVWYRDSFISGFASSREFVSGLFKKDEAESQLIAVQSSHNVGLTYDQRLYYASAVNANTGTLYVGSELSKVAPYTSVRLSLIPGSDIQGDIGQPSFTMTIHPSYSGNADLTTIALADAGINADSLVQFTPTVVEYGGANFSHTVLQAQSSDPLVANLKSQYSVYTTIKNGSLVTIVIAHGLTPASQDTSFDRVLRSLSFDTPVSAVVEPSPAIASKAPLSQLSQPGVISLLDSAAGVQKVAAASSEVAAVGASEKIGALYSPAVPKIYNFYCMDIQVNGVAFFKNVCSGSSGSGFILSQDGYVGTNGHVATADPRDLAIQQSVAYIQTKNDSRYFLYLVGLTSLRESDLAGKSSKDALTAMIEAIYQIDESKFKAVNSVQNLLVGIGNTAPDLTKLSEATAARREYPSNSSVVRAKLIASDYRQGELYTGKLVASDVALLKVEEGSNYPTVKLGAIADVTQGANLSIIGFPGNANTNGVVSDTSMTPTLTSGKVSSIKDASGSDKKLIETDTTIGHGNSGGPALNDSGAVVGIATYTADGSGDGDGTYNYIRDIADLKALLDDNSVIAEQSKTQIAWEAGMDKFYNSHYSSALKYFDDVKVLYPDHTKVNEFIASAQKHIANGDDVSEFPLWIVWVGLGVVLLGAGLATFFIIHHAKRHKVYKAGVAQGVVQPADMTKGVKQSVVVTPGAPMVAPVGGVAPASGLAAPIVGAAAPAVQPVATTSPVAPASPVLAQEPAPQSVQAVPATPVTPPTSPTEQPSSPPSIPTQNNQPQA